MRRGGVSLQLPEQEVARGPDGYELSYRAPFPVEGWNAQISLMTGMAAAELMLTGEVGILRTVPEADPARLAAAPPDGEGARRRPGRTGMSYPDFVRTLDPERAAARRAARRGRGADARVRLHGVRPRSAEGPDPCRARLDVRPHHGAAPATRRPLRRRGVRGALRRQGAARVGSRRAAEAARGDGGVGPEGEPVRGRDRLDPRGGDPRAERRADLRGRRRGGRQGRGRRHRPAPRPRGHRPLRRARSFPSASASRCASSWRTSCSARFASRWRPEGQVSD